MAASFCCSIGPVVDLKLFQRSCHGLAQGAVLSPSCPSTGSSVALALSFTRTGFGSSSVYGDRHNSKILTFCAAKASGSSTNDHNCDEPASETSEQERSITSEGDLITGLSLDRRQLLLSSLTVAGFPLINSQRRVLAAPIQAPDLTQCQGASLPSGAPQETCCLPFPTNIIDFQFDTSLPMRERKAAHLVDDAYIAKLNKAYELMRALPDSDPRKFQQQSNVHCAFCDSGYLQPNTSDVLQIHDSWLFFPWHRWYLYFHERILAKLLNDDTFALVFWNWDNQTDTTPTPNVIPSPFLNGASLIDQLRDPNHQPPTLVDLNYSGQDEGLDPASQRTANNNLMYQQVVSGAKTPSLFFGQAYRAGDANAPGPGSVENAPHGTVHVWTGDSSQPNFEDMGALYSAANDPIFFAHHSNVDRLWSVWKSLGGRRKDITDPDWLNATFVFYDENSNLVRVKVADALDTTKLSYTYQTVDNPWINPPSSLKSLSKTTAKAVSFNGVSSSPAVAQAAILDEIEEFGEELEGKFKKLEGAFRSKVKRPVKSLFNKLKSKISEDDLEEVLVIQGVEVPYDKVSKFDVFINLPDANEKTPLDIAEYVGSFVNVPHRSHGGMADMNRKSTFRIGIGDTLKQLGIMDLDSVVVTLVPKGKGKEVPIVIKGLKIEYD